MRHSGYIATALALVLAAFLQGQVADDLGRFVLWVGPIIVGLIGWLIQLVMVGRRIRQSIIKEMSEQLEKRLEHMESDLVSKIVDEIWHRLDTINKLTGYHEIRRPPTEDFHTER